MSAMNLVVVWTIIGLSGLVMIKTMTGYYDTMGLILFMVGLSMGIKGKWKAHDRKPPG